jgi:hypothetical protein
MSSPPLRRRQPGGAHIFPSHNQMSAMNLLSIFLIIIKCLHQLFDNSLEELTMTRLKDITKRIRDVSKNPPIGEAWAIEDDFTGWMAGQELTTRAFVCSEPEFANTPFCGVGSH